MEKHAPPTRESFKRKISEENPTLIQPVNPNEPVNPDKDIQEGEVVQVRRVISQVSISSTFYSSLSCTKMLYAAFL